MPPPEKTAVSGKIRSDIFGLDADIPRVVELKLEQIAPNPNQPRKFFDDEGLRDLAASIESKGLLQPILVKEIERGQYTVVAGERRFRAHRLINRDSIAAIITDGDEDEIALIENMQRENLRPMEEAEGLDRLIKLHDYTHDDVAKIIGKSRNRVSELLSILRLPESIKNECRTSDVASKSLLIELSKMNEVDQAAAWSAAKEGRSLTVQAARAKKQGREEEPDSPFARATRALYAAATVLKKVGELQPSESELEALKKARKELNAAMKKLEG